LPRTWILLGANSFGIRPSLALSYIGSVTARHSSSGRQPNFAALSRGHHLYSAGRPSRWASAHNLVVFNSLPYLSVSSVFLVLCSRLSCLLASFWTYVNKYFIAHRILLYLTCNSMIWTCETLLPYNIATVLSHTYTYNNYWIITTLTKYKHLPNLSYMY